MQSDINFRFSCYCYHTRESQFLIFIASCNMEIEAPEYSNLRNQCFDKTSENDSNNKYIKQTILNSPIFTNIFPSFDVRINKPFRGLTSSSFNDEEYQVRILKEEDSQQDAFDDDDDDLFLDDEKVSAKEVDVDPVKLKAIQVIIKSKSILANERITFAISSLRLETVLPNREELKSMSSNRPLKSLSEFFPMVDS